MNRLIDDLVNERIEEELINNFETWDPENLKQHIDTYKTLLIKGIITDSNVSSLELGGLNFATIPEMIGQSSTLSGQFTDTVAYRGVLYAWVDKAHHMYDNELKRMKDLIPSTADSYQAKVDFVTNLTKPRNTMALNDISLIKFVFDEECAENECAKTENREILKPGSAFLCEADLDAPSQPPSPKSEKKETNSPIVNDDQPRSNNVKQRNDEKPVKSSDTPNIIKTKQTRENTDKPGININDANHSERSNNVQCNATEHQKVTRESNSVPRADQEVDDVSSAEISSVIKDKPRNPLAESTRLSFHNKMASNPPKTSPTHAHNDDISEEISSVIKNKPRNPLAESTRLSFHNKMASNTPKMPPTHAHNTEINNEQGDQLSGEEMVNGPDEPVMDEPKTSESNTDPIDAQNLPKQIIPADAFNFIGTGAPPPSPVKSNPMAHTEGAINVPSEDDQHNDMDMGGNEMELLEEETPSSVGSVMEYPSRDDNLRAERANRISASSSEGSQIEGSQIARSPQKRKREPPLQNDGEREDGDFQEDMERPTFNPAELRFNKSESTILDTGTNGKKRKVSKKNLYFRRQGIRDPELPAPKRIYRVRAADRSDAPPHRPGSGDQPRNKKMQEVEQNADLPSFDMNLRNADPRESMESSLNSSPLGDDLNEPNNDSFGLPLDNYDYPMRDQQPGAPTTGQDLTHKLIYSAQFSKEVETYLGSFDPEGVDIHELVQRIADKENESYIYIYMLLMNDMGIYYAPLDPSTFNEPIKITTTKVAIQDTSVDEGDNNTLKLVKACLNNLNQARLDAELAKDPCDLEKADSQQKESKQEKSEQEGSEQKKSSQEEPLQEEARIVSQQMESRQTNPLEINSAQTQSGQARTENVQADGSEGISE